MSVWILVAVAGLLILGAGAVVAVFVFSRSKSNSREGDLDAPGRPAEPAVADPEAERSSSPRTLIPDEPPAPEPSPAPALPEAAPPAAPPPPPVVSEPEVPARSEPPVVEPVGEASPPEPVPPALEAPPQNGGVAFEPLEKIRIPDSGVVARASRATIVEEECFVLTTEGLAGRGGVELAFYAPYSSDIDVVRSLKRFAALALLLADRPAPPSPGEILRFPGEVGSYAFAGYLVLGAHEPVPVPLPEHRVLIGLTRSEVTHDASALRTALHARAGGNPWLTRPSAA